MKAEKKPVAWLIKNCPNFYFMPSMFYDRVFLKYEYGDGRKMSPAYLETRGYKAIPLYECEFDDAQYWISSTKNVIYIKRDAKSLVELGHKLTPVAPLN